MFRLTKQVKLIKADEFSSVFSLRKRIAGPFLVIRYKPNTLSKPRLGLIVAKKTAKSAVKRNYMRRVLRELFRLNQGDLPALDMVVQVQKTFEPLHFSKIQQEFAQLSATLNAKQRHDNSPASTMLGQMK